MTDKDILTEFIRSASRADLGAIDEISKTAESENRIPKLIHFCFVKWREMPDVFLEYISTWREVFGPDWTFVNWTPVISPFACEFERHMYGHDEYAFYADYIRVAKVYRYGGVYLDCDVMAMKDFSPLLGFNYVFDTEYTMSRLECGVFMSKKENRYLKIIKEKYESFTAADFSARPLRFLAPDVWTDALFDKGVTIGLKSFGDLCEYREATDKYNYYEMLALDGTWLSCTDMRNPENSAIRPHSYCAHGFEHSWIR